jgi:hypothetical protein
VLRVAIPFSEKSENGAGFFVRSLMRHRSTDHAPRCVYIATLDGVCGREPMPRFLFKVATNE